MIDERSTALQLNIFYSRVIIMYSNCNVEIGINILIIICRVVVVCRV